MYGGGVCSLFGADRQQNMIGSKLLQDNNNRNISKKNNNDETSRTLETKACVSDDLTNAQLKLLQNIYEDGGISGVPARSRSSSRALSIPDQEEDLNVDTVSSLRKTMKRYNTSRSERTRRPSVQETTYESLKRACTKITDQVPGYLVEFHFDDVTGRAVVWIGIDMVNVFGTCTSTIARLGVPLVGKNANTVVFQFAFASLVERKQAEFEQFCDVLPRSEEEKTQLALAGLELADEKKFSLTWLVDDRVRNKFRVQHVFERYGKKHHDEDCDDEEEEKKEDDDDDNAATTGAYDAHESHHHGTTDKETLEELLVNLGEFAGLVVENAPKHCLMCDKDLNVVMPKPCICSDSACIFQSRELGLGFCIEDEILNRPQVVELLLTFFCCSMLSRRSIDQAHIPKRIIEASSYPDDFIPFTDISPDEMTPAELTLFYALGFVPSIQVMVHQVKEGTFREHLDAIDSRLYPLFQWLIGTCRTTVRYIPPEKQFKDMHTPHQFVLDTAAAEKEFEFQKLRAKSGTFFAFHGSSSFAWSSIIANGLKNLSNTENMSYGAMKGEGIYVTTSFHTSTHYAKPTKLRQPWGNSFLGRHPRAISLCEIIDKPEDFVYTDQRCLTECTPQERAHGQLHVVPNENYVHTRYVFIYNEYITPPPPTQHIFALKSSQLEKLKQLQQQQQQQQGDTPTPLTKSDSIGHQGIVEESKIAEEDPIPKNTSLSSAAPFKLKKSPSYYSLETPMKTYLQREEEEFASFEEKDKESQKEFNIPPIVDTSGAEKFDIANSNQSSMRRKAEEQRKKRRSSRLIQKYSSSQEINVESDDNDEDEDEEEEEEDPDDFQQNDGEEQDLSDEEDDIDDDISSLDSASTGQYRKCSASTIDTVEYKDASLSNKMKKDFPDDETFVVKPLLMRKKKNSISSLPSSSSSLRGSKMEQLGKKPAKRSYSFKKQRRFSKGLFPRLDFDMMSSDPSSGEPNVMEEKVVSALRQQCLITQAAKSRENALAEKVRDLEQGLWKLKTKALE